MPTLMGDDICVLNSSILIWQGRSRGYSDCFVPDVWHFIDFQHCLPAGCSSIWKATVL
jgi:hypothetical protein